MQILYLSYRNYCLDSPPSLSLSSGFYCDLDPTKAEVTELENLGFMGDVSASLTNLLSLPLKEIKCVESIMFSSLNPPPSYRRFAFF